MDRFRWWGSGHSDLVEIAELSYAVKLLESYLPANDQQMAEKNHIVEFCNNHPDALFRSCQRGHLTASAIVVDCSRTRVLLHHHAKLDLWLQFGGHCDGDGNPPHVAWREAVEESGVPDLIIDPEIIDLDIHKIPVWKSEPEHLHLDVRFLVQAPEECIPLASKESLSLCWYSLSELGNIKTDASVLRLVELAVNQKDGNAI